MESVERPFRLIKLFLGQAEMWQAGTWRIFSLSVRSSRPAVTGARYVALRASIETLPATTGNRSSSFSIVWTFPNAVHLRSTSAGDYAARFAPG